MKSIVLKSLRQPPGDETAFNRLANPNLEFCIYSTCNLKSIKGFDFCYKHFKSYTGASDQNQPKVETSSLGLACEQTSQSLNGPVAENILSEQGFLYKDLMRKEDYQAHTNGDSSSEQDDDDGAEKAVRPRRTKRKDYDYQLSQAAVYSRNEIIKIFKSKIEKLDGLYKKQLAIINDNILISRKQFLTMKSAEEQSSPKAVSSNHSKICSQTQPELAKQLLALKQYKKQSNLKVHLKRKFGKYSEKETGPDSSQTCKYQHTAFNGCNSNKQDTVKCSNKVIPLSGYCLKHILNEPNQVLFFKCPGNPKDTTNTCDKPLIESISLECPIHVSNRFVDSNLNSIPDELIESDNTTEDEALSMQVETESDRSATDSAESVQQEEQNNPRMELDSMINNVKLISVIKEEQLDQEDTVI